MSGESPAWPPVRQDISELAEPFVCRMETIHELSIAACAHSLAVFLTLKNSIVLTREEGGRSEASMWRNRAAASVAKSIIHRRW